MNSSLIPISFHKVLQSQSYTIVVLGSKEKQFAIYMEPHVGKEIQHYLARSKNLRPSSHDLIQSILAGSDLKPLQIVISDVEESIYFAKLFLEKTEGDVRTVLEIDARPSDCLVLALLSNARMFCEERVMEKALAYE